MHQAENPAYNHESRSVSAHSLLPLIAEYLHYERSVSADLGVDSGKQDRFRQRLKALEVDLVSRFDAIDVASLALLSPDQLAEMRDALHILVHRIHKQDFAPHAQSLLDSIDKLARG